MLLVFYAKGLYRSRSKLSVLHDFPTIFSSVLIAAAFGFSVALNVANTLSARTIAQFIGLVAALLVALVVAKAIAYFLVHRARESGYFLRRVAIVGTGLVANQLAQAAADPRNGIVIVGYVDQPLDSSFVGGSQRPILGSPSEINKIISDYSIDHVIVAFSWIRETDLVGMIRKADRRSCDFSTVERFFEITTRSRGTDELSGIPLALLQRRAYRSIQWRGKRLMDIAVSGTAIVLLSPLLLAVAFVCRIKDGSGIIFRQQRISLDGEPFEIMKFRSLHPANDAESATKWNVKNDERMSGFGKFMRKTSIDELPQLFNILNGDMSLVGPRPERPHFVEEFGGQYRHYDHRHRVPSGLTGWSQVNGLRGDTSIEERARFDNYYIQNWSLWLDIKIMLLTTIRLTRSAG